jgi:hypothetical protein
MLNFFRIILLPLLLAGKLSAADKSVYITQKISFSNTTLAPAGTTWEWDFGDGSPHSTNKEPVHAYKEPGPFTVLLKVKPPNLKNAIPSNSLQVEVKGVDLKIEITPKKFFVGQEVAFKTQYDASLPLKFEWDFGDGKTSNQPAPKHRFSKSGKQTVKLKVIVPDGDALPAPDISPMVEGILIEIKGPDQTEFDTSTPVKIDNLTKGPRNLMTWQWKIMGPDGKPVELDDAAAHDADNLLQTFETEGEHAITLKANIPDAPDVMLPESDPIVITISSSFETPAIKEITVAPSRIGANGDYTAQIIVDTTGDYKMVGVAIEGLKNPPAQKKGKAGTKGRHIFEFSVPIPSESVSRKPIARDIVISATIHPESPNGRPIEIPQTISLTIIPQQPGWILYLYIAGGILVMAIIAWLAIRTARS